MMKLKTILIGFSLVTSICLKAQTYTDKEIKEKSTLKVEIKTKETTKLVEGVFFELIFGPTDNKYYSSILLKKSDVANAKAVTLFFKESWNGLESGKIKPVVLSLDDKYVIYHPNPKTDLIAVLVGPLYGKLKQEGFSIDPIYQTDVAPTGLGVDSSDLEAIEKIIIDKKL